MTPIKSFRIYFLHVSIFLAVFYGCKPGNVNSDGEKAVESKTPVTVTQISVEPVSESIELNATTLFQKKVPVKANAIGYIYNVTVGIGDEVVQDQLLFTIKTKEASAFEIPGTIKDSTLNFSGIIKIKAQKSGVMSTIDHQKGDYVQDGDQLGIISERGSLVFRLDVPFELHREVKIGSSCEILLPDSEVIKGQVSSELPAMDAVSQTQSFVVKASLDKKLPENLICKIRIARNVKEKARVLPKAAILTDETQTDFWVMKLINDSTAVKVPVKKGIETKTKTEILEPVFSGSDRIILNGNYGLADTAKVNIVGQ